MAVQDSENPSHPGARLSPGDAAFERLRQREALRMRDKSASVLSAPECNSAMFIGPPLDPATLAAPPVAGAEAASEPSAAFQPAIPAVVARAMLAAPMLAEPHPGAEPRTGEPVDRVLAMAAAFGIEAATPDSIDEPPALAETRDELPALAAAPDVPEPAPAPAFDFVPPPVFVPPAAEDRPAAPSGTGDATAARLEAALLDQLRSLEETLIEDSPHPPERLPRAAPLRPATGAPRAPAPDSSPQRSVFAPDPVRQRTYVDLRTPSPLPERAMSDDPPWRKYLAEPSRRGTPGRGVPRRPTSPPAGRQPTMAAAIHDRKAEVAERGRGIRAMTAAAVLGLGVGLGVLVLVRPFVDPGNPDVAASVAGTPAPVVASLPTTESGPAAAPGAGSHVDLALATLLADPPVSRATPGHPAVISEPGTSPIDVAAASPVEPEPVAAAAPPVIRPPPGEARAVARAPNFEAANSGPLAYGPTVPSYDPVRQQLLQEEADGKPAATPRAQVAARAPAEAEPAAAPVRPGRATINSFVNMRAKPDNSATVVAMLAEGLAVKVIACDYWCEIEAGGKHGFVYQEIRFAVALPSMSRARLRPDARRGKRALKAHIEPPGEA